MLKKVFLLTLIMATVWSSVVMAAGDRVVFYPDGAELTQDLKAQVKSDVNGDYVMFTLSSQAVPDSFSIKSMSTGVAVNDVSWTRDSLSESPAALEIAKKIDQLKFKLAKVISQKTAVKGGIEFWNERGKNPQTNTSDLDKVAGLVVSNLAKLYETSAELDVKITELKELIDDLHRKLEDATGYGRMVWKVKVSVSAKGLKTGEFRVSYMLKNCGWVPKYKLDAYPEKNQVRFTFEAEIHQGSGVDFKDCSVALATVKKRSRISPPTLPRWSIQPKPEVEVAPMANRAYKTAVMSEAMDMAVQMAPPPPAPRKVQKATYSLWEIGSKTIPAGTTRKYAVEDEVWDVAYTFLARPSLTPDVYVSAEAKLNDARDYPVGPALIFMEGAMIGKNQFVFSGKKKTVFFGSDPMLKAERKTLEKQSGEKGMFGSKQTYSWKYLIELESSRKRDVDIKIQEAAPVSGDKRIKLTLVTKPEAKIKDDNFEWAVKVPASGKASVEYSVEMNAPDDMNIDVGLGQ